MDLRLSLYHEDRLLRHTMLKKYQECIVHVSTQVHRYLFLVQRLMAGTLQKLHILWDQHHLLASKQKDHHSVHMYHLSSLSQEIHIYLKYIPVQLNLISCNPHKEYIIHSFQVYEQVGKFLMHINPKLFFSNLDKVHIFPFLY